MCSLSPDITGLCKGGTAKFFLNYMSASPLTSSIFASLPKLLPEDSELGRTITWEQLLLFSRLSRRIAPATYALSQEYLEPNEVTFLSAALNLPDRLISECWLLLRRLVYLAPASNRVSDDDYFRHFGADYKVGQCCRRQLSAKFSPTVFFRSCEITRCPSAVLRGTGAPGQQHHRGKTLHGVEGHSPGLCQELLLPQ